jgi:hypothetical protein
VKFSEVTIINIHTHTVSEVVNNSKYGDDAKLSRFCPTRLTVMCHDMHLNYCFLTEINKTLLILRDGLGSKSMQ